jgi:hypothetical protein
VAEMATVSPHVFFLTPLPLRSKRLEQLAGELKENSEATASWDRLPGSAASH